MKHKEPKDPGKHEWIISELWDNFKWTTTCAIGVKEISLGRAVDKRKIIEEIVANFLSTCDENYNLIDPRSSTNPK